MAYLDKREEAGQVTNPIASVGVVWGVLPDAPDALPVLLGSCFLFQSDSYALTAAHCIQQSWELFCDFPVLESHRVAELKAVTHPTADLAILQLATRVGQDSAVDSNVRPGVDPAYGFMHMGAYALGSDVLCFGYPSEITSLELSQMQPRLFKGHIQTFYDHPYGQHAYEVAELSFPAPGGLSGAPVFRPANGGLVVGVITMNHDSERITDSIEEVSRDGSTLRITGKRIVSYALALTLSGHSDWLDQTIPPIVMPPQ